jgi:flagellar hook-basal body complex protein FliE
MSDPLNIQGIQPGNGAGPVRPLPGMPSAQPVEGKSFKDTLLSSLEQVNQLQQEATDGVNKLVTGETDNVAEVFSAVRKAGVAFDLLMEMRNKMVDAYNEIQQMRV